VARSLSLRQRIFWWSAGSTLIVLATVFFFVDRSLRSTIVAGLQENVEAEARLAAELQRSSVSAGVERVANLAGAPTIRAAVETGDPATVRRNLEDFQQETNAAWIAVASPTGDVIAFVGDAPVDLIQSADVLMDQARFYDTGDIWLVDDILHQVSAGGVFFEQGVLGVLLIGDPIGADQVELLEVATQQRISILSGNAVVAARSDVPESDRDALLNAFLPMSSTGSTLGASPRATSALGSREPDAEGLVREFSLGGEPHLGMALPILDASGLPAAYLVAYRSLADALAPARTVRFTLLGIAAVGIALALALSLGLSRGVTRPIDRLLKETIRIGAGDLKHPIEADGDDEIGRLAEGFESMRSSLAVAQRELVRAERLSAVGQAASGIVHDFKQPMTVIRARMDLLEEEKDDPAAQEEDLQAIRDEIDRITRMMQEILDFARGEDRITMTVGSIGSLLNDVADRYRAQLDAQRTTLELELGYPGEWRLDFPRTSRVIENLIHNSATALGSGGTIWLRSRESHDELLIEVADDGPGIDESLQDRLFEPFVTTGKREGTGLGLAIARSFTERQGGRIRFATSPAGTTFVLEFRPGATLESESPGSAVGAANSGVGG
jgi:signal transduction histidine kinase